MKRTFLTLFFLLITPIAFADTTLQSLLVSIEKYEIAPLDYAENDIKQFAYLLTTRYNGSAQACVDTPNNERGGDAPMKAVMEKIKKWCESLKNDDTAVLYLAGHGVKDADGRLYLAMINFDRKNFKTAAIPLEWIRDQFGKAKGKHKLLLLDTCFAGTAKSVDFEQAGSAESAAAFAKLKNVVVIASSREDEKSWLWDDVKHSLFTYWFIEAFKGHADSDNDQILTCDEIVQYLQKNVSATAKNALNRQQHPVVFNAEAGKGFRLPLRALSPEGLIADMASQIDLLMRLEWKRTGGRPRIAIPEFTSDEYGTTFDPKYGSLPRWASGELRNAVVLAAQKNQNNYSVLSEKATRQLMQSRGLTPGDLGTEKMNDVQIDGKEVLLHIDGRLTLAENGCVALRAVLSNGEAQVGEVGGVAMLSAAKLGMTETSVVLTGTSPRPEARLISEPGVGLVDPEQKFHVAEILAAGNTLPPIVDRKSPFKVRFQVRPINTPNAAYKERKIVVEGNRCFLTLAKGEEYRIMVECETEHEVFVRVLVDGLNTLSQPEKIITRGAIVEAAGPADEGEYVVMPRVSLDDARAWAMQPKQEYKIEGFYDAKKTKSTLQRFQVVDADDSAAARKNYTDQLGLITIGFFKPAPKPNVIRGDGDPEGLGTAGGSVEDANIKMYSGTNVPGAMMAVYNIRYLTQKALDKMEK